MLPWVISGLLFLVCVILMIKIALMKRSMEEIRVGMEEILSEDTNRLLSVSSKDRHVILLAVSLNRQLRLLRKQRQIYLSKNREVTETITNVSHDLRTPLTAISGYLELLQEEEVSPAAKEYLSCIRERTQALKNLTEELFQYLLTSSPKNQKPEIFDANRALQDELLGFYAAFFEKHITPLLELPDEPVFVVFNASAFGRICSNLLQNILKYSEGSVSVSLSENGVITFSNETSQLDELQVKRLFWRFYTVETAQYATGLGLSIASALAEQLGGSLTADYKAGRLDLILSLPLAEQF